MLSDEIRTRLAALTRAAEPPASFASGGRPAGHAPLSDHRVDAAEMFATAEELENASGRHWRFRRPLADIWPGVRRLTGIPSGRLELPAGTHAELAAVAEYFPQGTLFLDLETCGFAGSPIFLVGTVWLDDGTLFVDQFFARNYAEERAILETLWQVAAANRVLVTFNGKSFDWPMVHDRSTRHHLGRDARGHSHARPCDQIADGRSLGRSDPRPQLEHCDLLHHARRQWKNLLPNCKLQTLERYICRRQRAGDIAGSDVPLAYHEFVRSGHTGAIAAILEHNALDLVTLVQLTLRMLRPSAGASAPNVRRVG